MNHALYTLKDCCYLRWEIEERRLQIYGRKIPLLDIRARLMKQQEQYMRLTTDEEFQAMTRSEMLSLATKWHVHLPPDVSDLQLLNELAQAQ